jgi:hypothetical protein
MYLSALCEGLDSALVPYRATLRRIEAELLARPAMGGLSLLQHLLLPHRPVLRALSQLLRQDCGSALICVAGSGSRRAKMTHKK